MRILCVTPWFPHRPTDQHGNFILDSVLSLIEIGHHVAVLVTPAWRPQFAHYFNKNWKKKAIRFDQFPNTIKFYHCEYFSLPRHYFCPISFRNYKKNVIPLMNYIIEKEQIQIIHAQTELAGIAAVPVGKQKQLPTVITLHGESTEKKLYVGATKKQLFDYPLTHADRIVLVGKPLVTFAKQFVSDSKHFRVIPNGFRLSFANSSENKNWDLTQFKFISVSNLEEGKGIHINLQALARLNSIGIRNWHYKIIGDGTEINNLKKLAHNLMLDTQVSFLGAVTHDFVYQELNQNDIFILPSYREAFGVAYIEAMSCGLLAIGVENQGPQAFIENSKTGFLVKPKSVDSLFSTFKKICESPDEIQLIAINGQKHVKENFTWQNHALKLTHLYENLLKEYYV